MSYVPKEIQEEVNVTPIHPLKFFAQIIGVIFVGGVVLYGVTGIAADQISKHLDPKLEKAIGKSFSGSIPTSSAPIDQATRDYLQTLITKIQPPNLAKRPPVTVHLWQTETVNAAALPGGEILVTTGLLEFVESENELAFVLAHELGHHQFRHPIRRLGRSLLWTTVLSVLGIGNQNTIPLDQTVTGLSGITDLHFSRSQELEADRFALETVIQHYQHGGHSLDFFERLPTLQEGLPPAFDLEIVSTHPHSGSRIKKLKAIAQDNGWNMTGSPTPLPQDVNEYKK